jgi:hypothetical protein
MLGCFGLTEPDFGSNPSGMVTNFQGYGRSLSLERCQNVDFQFSKSGYRRSMGQRTKQEGFMGLLWKEEWKAFLLLKPMANGL